MFDLIPPLLVLHVVWHPAFSEGEKIFEMLFNHFRRDHYKNIVGGTGMPIQRWSAPPAPKLATPLPIDLYGAATNAIIVLADRQLAAAPAWVVYIRDRSALRL
ncbi:MAG: hypothetical protein V9G98_13030 [Candidatus Competibacter sp.]|nr:hypothetical protein [Nitrospira sp.]